MPTTFIGYTVNGQLAPTAGQLAPAVAGVAPLGTTVAASQGMSALGTAAVAAGGSNPIGLAVMAAMQFAKALEGATEKAKQFREGLSESSPHIAAIQQEANVRNLARARGIGAETAESTREAMRAEQEKLDRRKDIDVAIDNLTNRFSTLWEQAKGDIYGVLGPFIQRLNQWLNIQIRNPADGPFGADQLLNQFAKMEEGWRKARNPNWEPRPVPNPVAPPPPNPWNAMSWGGAVLDWWLKKLGL